MKSTKKNLYYYPHYKKYKFKILSTAFSDWWLTTMTPMIKHITYEASDSDAVRDRLKLSEFYFNPSDK